MPNEIEFRNVFGFRSPLNRTFDFQIIIMDSLVQREFYL